MRQLLFFLFFLLPDATFSATTGGGSGGECNRHCNSLTVPYPFGFSGNCPMLLKCNDTASTPLLPHSTAAAPYPILSFNSTAYTLLVSVEASCSRSVADAQGALAGAGYDVTSRTGIFLRGGCDNNSPGGSNCSVPATILAALLRASRCGGNESAWTCASQPPLAGQFIEWAGVRAAGCRNAVSAAVYAGGDTAQGTASLELGVAELGWWLDGACANGTSGGRCAQNATCRDVVTPGGAPGHRCACVNGMDGDGFAAGDGCYYYRADGSKKNVLLIVAGVLVGLVAAGGAFLLWRAQCRRSKSGRWGSERLAALRLLSEAATSSGVPVYSYQEVARATNSFSHTHRLGTGAYGTVYVGKLPASAPALVAIKRLRGLRRHHEDDDGGGDDAALLLNEIRLISSVSHPNLVRLLGCCLDRGEQILVYEYVPNGTLSQHLLGGGRPRLPWRARLGVAAETAAAIAHLHGMRPPIFHRDVKSSNILLDAGLRPKLADFGLSRAVDRLDLASRSHVSTAPQGTPGYVDPEYHQNFHLSDKSDVYSFGVVLLELITAMKVVDFDRPAAEVNLASLALDRIGKGRVAEIVDPAILDDEGGWVMDSVRHVSELAFRCLAFHKDVRPCMSEVAAELRAIRSAAPDPDSHSDLGSTLRQPPMTDVEIDVSLDNGTADHMVVVAKSAVSPVSVQEAWVSDQSSPSTNGSISMPRAAA